VHACVKQGVALTRRNTTGPLAIIRLHGVIAWLAWVKPPTV